jgi:KDO2-lipid IV(A) lauroyltransferase
MKGRILIATITLLSWFPLGFSRGLGSLLGHFLFLSNSRMKQTTVTNIAICLPHLSEQEQKSLARKSLQETCKTIMESGAVWLWSDQKILSRVRVSNADLLEKAVNQGKGVLMIGPHHGNWEIAGLYLGSCGFAPNISLYQAPKDEAMGELILKARKRGGATLVPTTTRGVAALVKGLRNGSIIGILPDQVPADNSGEFAPFFGRPALTMSLIYGLMKKTGCACLMTYARRVEGEKGVAFEVEIREPDARVFSEDLQEALTGLNATVEMAALDNPSQYQWEYKRFRRQPEESDRPY